MALKLNENTSIPVSEKTTVEKESLKKDLDEHFNNSLDKNESTDVSINQLGDKLIMNRTLKQLIDEFMQTWVNIYISLSNEKYDFLFNETSIFEKFKKFAEILKKIFDSKNSFNLGIGLILLSFFIYFILLSTS